VSSKLEHAMPRALQDVHACWIFSECFDFKL
jgi:hypothetical protein